jgi:hypothetical protein
MDFKSTLDLNLLSHLFQSVTAGIVNPEYYIAQLLSMMPYSDDWTVDNVLNPEFGKEEQDELNYSPFSAKEETQKPSLDKGGEKPPLDKGASKTTAPDGAKKE